MHKTHYNTYMDSNLEYTNALTPCEIRMLTLF